MLDIHQEILLFETLGAAALNVSTWDVENTIEHTLTIKPRTLRQKIARKKPIDLTFAGIIHGNETGGLAVCNRLLAALLEDPEELSIGIGFILGNPSASRANIRFIARDLNRSFERTQNTSEEDKRARQLEVILKDSRFLLDFHQTREPSAFPFFISPYTPESFGFAGAINAEIPMITHWGKPFSGEGRCSDEFVNRSGGVGLTLELGRNGFDLRQILTGVAAGLKAIKVISNLDPASFICKPASTKLSPRKIYTWAQAVSCPDPESYMKPGFQNFSPVKKGDYLGTIYDRSNDAKNEIYSAQDGFVLFPKYIDPDRNNQHATAAMEFCRIVKEISEDDLGR